MVDVEHDPSNPVETARTSTLQVDEERRQRDLELNDLRHVMSSKEGRRFVWRQLGNAGVYQLSFNSDAARMAFNEGQRNIGLKLLDDVMEACPNQYANMLREQRELKERNEQRNVSSRE